MGQPRSEKEQEGPVMAIGTCGACGKPLAYNPMTVPSACNKHGVRRPICRACVAKWRASHPGQQFTIPADAYGEPGRGQGHE